MPPEETELIPSFSIDPDNPPIAAIHELLAASFTAETLARFCKDDPLFRPVVDTFGPGHGLAAMVDRVIEYCEKMLLWDDLLKGVKDVNPRQHARFASSFTQRGTTGSTAPPAAPPTPAIPTPETTVFDQQGQTVGTQINIAGNVYGTLPEPVPPGAGTATLRARLGRLDAVEIESLCLDHFSAVYDKFGRGQRRDEMINLLLDQCRRNPGDAARLAALLR
ncbi:MAG: hypothetical protein JXA93_24440 [Anaerolineae bacterium]|nr:hypothetical protein [Anaerolineae bacterium]